jgi:hypothetical protein
MGPRTSLFLDRQMFGLSGSTKRSDAGGAMTIRSRIGSRGMVITSTMTLPSSRRSVTFPRASAGAVSIASGNSTASPTFISRATAIAPIVGLRICGDQSRSVIFQFVMPCGESGRGSTVDHQIGDHPATDAGSRSPHPGNGKVQNSFGNHTPDQASLIRANMEDAFPFGSVSFPEDPLQLGLSAPSVLGPGERLSNDRLPLHSPDAKEGNCTCVQPKSIFEAANGAEL